MAKDNSRLKMALIVGASEALKHRNQNPNKRDDEILKEITKRASEILDNID